MGRVSAAATATAISTAQLILSLGLVFEAHPEPQAPSLSPQAQGHSVDAGVPQINSAPAVPADPAPVAAWQLPAGIVLPTWLEPYSHAWHNASVQLGNHGLVLADGSDPFLGRHFRLPINRAVPIRDVRPSGDPRAYRHGIHQGNDVYKIQTGDRVVAAAAGVVMRADLEYTELTSEVRADLLMRCHRDWLTTPGEVGSPAAEPPYNDVLDRLRGRQVWILHGATSSDEPIISIYAHLKEIDSKVSVGTVVLSGDVLGIPGNSGTGAGVRGSTTDDVHLHFELMIGNRYWMAKRANEVGKAQKGKRRRQQQKAFLATFPFSASGNATSQSPEGSSGP